MLIFKKFHRTNHPTDFHLDTGFERFRAVKYQENYQGYHCTSVLLRTDQYDGGRASKPSFDSMKIRNIMTSSQNTITFPRFHTVYTCYNTSTKTIQLLPRVASTLVGAPATLPSFWRFDLSSLRAYFHDMDVGMSSRLPTVRGAVVETPIFDGGYGELLAGF